MYKQGESLNRLRGMNTPKHYHTVKYFAKYGTYVVTIRTTDHILKRSLAMSK